MLRGGVACALLSLRTYGLRRGLPSFAASRLEHLRFFVDLVDCGHWRDSAIVVR
jgi:hypothetical protein